jgi:stage III sporulation protein SpoIIIAA
MSKIQLAQAREDLDKLLSILPSSIRLPIEQNGRETDLLEVVMDLGRQPTARYTDSEIILRNEEVKQAEIDQVVTGIGEFDDDNRAGITRTLHRISAIRNRKGLVVGLTCRVGRAVYGTIGIVEDIIATGKSVLLLGRPGVGKTTLLRETARVLAESRRVVIVDTSNEIGGDGDIPHPAVGRARRMQVPRPSHQHETMIEAVENHNPEVIIIDEIGREREAAAARTINERGVQLVGTAHGHTLENLLLNPTLSDLVGGIESVTLSDEEARRRGTQKTVLERRAPPTFDVLVEIQDRSTFLVHTDVTSSVDGMLRGYPMGIELRSWDEEGAIHVEKKSMVVTSSAVTGRRDDRRGRLDDGPTRIFGDENQLPGRLVKAGERRRNGNGRGDRKSTVAGSDEQTEEEAGLRIYAYGVARNRLLQAARRLKVKIQLVDHLSEAEVLVTLKSYYRKRRQLIHDAERRRTPVYVLRANTTTQMENFLIQVLDLDAVEGRNDPFERAIAEAEQGIQTVRAGQQSVDLRPVGSAIRRYQHQMVRQADLVSHSYGKEPNRYVRIFNVSRQDKSRKVNGKN